MRVATRVEAVDQQCIALGRGMTQYVPCTSKPRCNPEGSPLSSLGGAGCGRNWGASRFLISYEPHVPGSTPAREPDSGH